VTTPAQLRQLTVKQLADMARDWGLSGYGSLRKEELVSVLAAAARRKAAAEKRAEAKATAKATGKKPKSSQAKKKKTPATSTKRTGSAAKRSTKDVNQGRSSAKVNTSKKASASKKKPKPGSQATNKSVPKSEAAKKSTKTASHSRPCGEAPVPKTRRRATRKARPSTNGKTLTPSKPATLPKKRRAAIVAEHVDRLTDAVETSQGSSTTLQNKNGHDKRDRLILTVRDAYWLQACWELSHRSIERVQAAMGRYWHSAIPVLRLFEIRTDGVSSIERKFVRDIEIHGAVNTWYIDVKNPPSCYLVEVGYRSCEGRFFPVTRSNSIETPQMVEAVDGVGGNWSEVAQEFSQFHAGPNGRSEEEELREAFDEKHRSPAGSRLSYRLGTTLGASLRQRRDFNFAVDAEMIVHGVTEPDTYLSIKGQPVQVRADGSFSVRFTLPERRLVLPIVAATNDGIEQRTIILAIERNTKVMEPIIREPDEI
jgi:uncharacterized protein